MTSDQTPQMTKATLRIIGCGDAFCSGGRYQTCFHLSFRDQSLLLDFGPSALVPLKKTLASFNHIDQILISHLHGDHFGGVPFLLLDAQFASQRQHPLCIAGPRGVRRRIEDLIVALFPNLMPIDWRFPLSFVELEAKAERLFDEIKVKAYEVDHPDPSPTLALRLEFENKVLAFSGDTGWTDTLVEVADDADLFLCECHSFKPNKIHHLDWETLNANRSSLRAKRIVLTHMSESMLDRLPTLDPDCFEFAFDGMSIVF